MLWVPLFPCARKFCEQAVLLSDCGFRGAPPTGVSLLGFPSRMRLHSECEAEPGSGASTCWARPDIGRAEFPTFPVGAWRPRFLNIFKVVLLEKE